MSLATDFSVLRGSRRVAPAVVEDLVTARILTIDIETTPTTAHVWGMFDQNVGLNQIVEVGGLLSFSWKWYGDAEVSFESDWCSSGGGDGDFHALMVRRAWELLDEADYVVGFNSISFDMKHLNREFVLAGLPAPSPYRNVDLLRVARRQFKFFSNKLDFVASQLGLGHKVSHEGHGLWVACMGGDVEARARMEEYNNGDVRLTEELFDRLRPWLGSVMNLGLHSLGDGVVCPVCGGDELVEDGTLETSVSVYVANRCAHCGAISRGLELRSRVRQRAV